MAIKKIKISELPLAQSLVGLYTIGVDALNRSVKVGLEFVKNAAASATTAAAATALALATQDTADHPTYVGQDFYVYKWNSDTKSYDKTDIYVKGEGFSIEKVYDSVGEMNADYNNPSIKVGQFVLVNTMDTEHPDNAKLYVKGSSAFEFVVDMSGAVGFHYK